MVAWTQVATRGPDMTGTGAYIKLHINSGTIYICMVKQMYLSQTYQHGQRWKFVNVVYKLNTSHFFMLKRDSLPVTTYSTISCVYMLRGECQTTT